MGSGAFKIMLKNRDRFRMMALRDMLKILFKDWKEKSVDFPTNCGYFYVGSLICDSKKLLEYLKEHRRYREVERHLLRHVGPPPLTPQYWVDAEIESKLIPIILDDPDILSSMLAHVVLLTGDLWTHRRRIDAEVRSVKHLHEAVGDLKKWESKLLWKLTRSPFGEAPSDERIKKMPEEKRPFIIEEIRWNWEWEDKEERVVEGYMIDICDLRVYPDETFVKLEKRIDRAIAPIKKYLISERKLIGPPYFYRTRTSARPI